MTKYGNVDKFWQVIGLQCESLLLQADELIRIGNQLMGPFEKDDIRNGDTLAQTLYWADEGKAILSGLG